MTVTTGQLLAQRYRLGRRIAVGGMGEVWEAEDTRLGRQVAVKVLKPELSGDPEFRARFQTEARMTASLNHPGIAAVHDYGETDVVRSGTHSPHTDPNTAYLVMELVAGDPLSAILQRQPRLPADRTLDILGQAAEAVAAAHERGLVHRDIKPANILITPAGRVKLTDFGIAKARDAADNAPVTRAGMVMGTAHYIAPEQAAGYEAGPASDVYSLGVVGYECLAGQRPFVTDSAVAVAMMHIQETPPPLPPDVPRAARALVEAAMAKDPQQRYRTGGEFAAAVAAVRAGRKPPLPSGLMGSAPTTAMTGHHPAQTALLPPGALSGPYTAVPTGPPSGPHSGPRPAPYTGARPEQRRSSQRTAMGVAIVLLVVLGLVLGGYLIREVVRSSGTTPDSPGGVPAAPPPVTTTAPQPAGPAEPAPTTETPEPTTQETTPEPTRTEEEPEQVVINPFHYLGKSGSAAADQAREDGLEPRVIDDKGDEIDSGDQSKCRVTNIDPAFGSAPAGSSLELTCRGGL